MRVWFHVCVEGMGRFLSGVTDEMKQRHRERLFAVSHKSLVDAAERYAGICQAAAPQVRGSVCVSGGLKTSALVPVQVPRGRSEDVCRRHLGPRERGD